jgi:hypothetical protein
LIDPSLDRSRREAVLVEGGEELLPIDLTLLEPTICDRTDKLPILRRDRDPALEMSKVLEET